MRTDPQWEHPYGKLTKQPMKTGEMQNRKHVPARLSSKPNLPYIFLLGFRSRLQPSVQRKCCGILFTSKRFCPFQQFGDAFLPLADDGTPRRILLHVLDDTPHPLGCSASEPCSDNTCKVPPAPSLYAWMIRNRLNVRRSIVKAWTAWTVTVESSLLSLFMVSGTGATHWEQFFSGDSSSSYPLKS